MEKKQEKRQTKMSPVGEIPMLEFDLRTKMSNIMEVKSALSPYSFRQYRTLGNCIEDLQIEDIPAIDTTQVANEIEYAALIKKRLDKVELRRQELVHLYGVVLGCLSVVSREKVVNSTEFQRIRESNDGLRLWSLVYNLHANGRGVASVAERYNQAERNYVNCIQREGESLSDFYERFKSAVRVMHQMTADPARNVAGSPQASVAAVKFISNLNRSQYGELQRVLHNSGEYPATLPEALERAGTYEPVMKPVKSDRVQYGAAVFNNSARRKNSESKKSESRNSESDDKSKGSFRGKCFNCGKIGHKRDDCRSKRKPSERRPHHEEAKSNFHVEFESDEEDKFNFTVLSGVKGSRKFDEYELVFDSGAQISVVKSPKLLTNIRQGRPITLLGMNDSAEGISCDQIGDLLNFGTAYLCEHAKANLLSQGCARPHCRKITLDDNNNEYVIIDKEGERYVFREKENIYSCNIREKFAFSLSKKEIEASKLVRDIQRRMAFESDHGLKIALKNGSINNLPITTRDVDNAASYWGKDIGMLKGKTTSVPPTAHPMVEVTKYNEVPQTLEVDLFYVQGHAFLCSVSDPLDLTMVNYLSESSEKTIRPKKLENIRSHIFNQLDAYRNEGFNVTKISYDSESVLKSIASELVSERYKVRIAAPGRHGVPRLDRKIRMIKERCRCIVSTLPYDLPGFLIPWCVKFVVSRINMIRRKESTLLSNESPKEAFTGIKTNFISDINIGFGEYVQVIDINQSNSLKERSISCLSLMPMSDGTGGVKFYCLKSKAIVIRDAWINVPIPDTVVDYLNRLAKPEKNKCNIEPTFPADAHECESPKPHEEGLNDAAPVLEEPTSGGAESDPVPNPDPVSSPPTEQNGSQSGVDEEPDLGNQSHADEELPPDESVPHSLAVDEGMQPTVESSGPRIVDAVRTRGNRFGYRRFFESEIKRAFNLSVSNATRLFGDVATSSIKAEIQQMLEKKVWTPIRKEEIDVMVIPSKMFLKEKRDPNGALIKIKARLVAGGHLQNREEHRDTSSPTLSYPSLLIISLLAAKYGHRVVTVDITGAYLNADMDERVLMRLNKDIAQHLVDMDPTYAQYRNEKGDVVVKLLKALYGCVQSSKLWYLTLKRLFTAEGFKCSTHDECVFVKEDAGVLIIVAVYVDDIIIQSSEESMINKIINILKSSFLEIKVNRGKVHQYLGMMFNYETPGKVSIKMTGYINDLVEKMGVSSTASTPATRDLFKIDDSEQLLDQKGQDEVRSVVYQLLYVCTRVVPEALLAVNFLCTRVNKYVESDRRKLLRIVQYINGRKDIGVMLSCDQDIHVYVYADASYAPHSDARSQTGMVLRVGDSSIVCKSSKQKLVTKSSTEAELVGAVDSVQQLFPIRGLLNDLGVSCHKFLLMQDNMSTISMIKSKKCNSIKSRHINIRYHYLRERIDMGEFDVVYVPTSEMVADILTKPLQGTLFRSLRDRLIGV